MNQTDALTFFTEPRRTGAVIDPAELDVLTASGPDRQSFEFDEEKHPRDEKGRFDSVGGGESAEPGPAPVVDLMASQPKIGDHDLDNSNDNRALAQALDHVPPNTAIVVDGWYHHNGYGMGRAVAIRGEDGLTVLRELRPQSEELMKNAPPGAEQRFAESVLADIRESHAGVVAAFDGNAEVATRIQGTYIIANGRNPDDDHFAQLYDAPGFRSSASADGKGALTSWNGQYPTLGIATHEAGHQLDGWLGRPSDMEWRGAVDGDRQVAAELRAAHGGYVRDPLQAEHPVMLDGEGVTTYGRADKPHEDFAEAFRLYAAEKAGADLRVVMGDGHRPTFSEAFPNRKDLLDVGVDHAKTILGKK